MHCRMNGLISDEFVKTNKLIESADKYNSDQHDSILEVTTVDDFSCSVRLCIFHVTPTKYFPESLSPSNPTKFRVLSVFLNNLFVCKCSFAHAIHYIQLKKI